MLWCSMRNIVSGVKALFKCNHFFAKIIGNIAQGKTRMPGEIVECILGHSMDTCICGLNVAVVNFRNTVFLIDFILMGVFQLFHFVLMAVIQ